MIKTYGTRNYSRSRIRDVHITRPKTYVEHETTQELEIRDVYIITLTKPSHYPFNDLEAKT